jgi:hypothetical protein
VGTIDGVEKLERTRPTAQDERACERMGLAGAAKESARGCSNPRMSLLRSLTGPGAGASAGAHPCHKAVEGRVDVGAVERHGAHAPPHIKVLNSLVE